MEPLDLMAFKAFKKIIISLNIETDDLMMTLTSRISFT